MACMKHDDSGLRFTELGKKSSLPFCFTATSACAAWTESLLPLKAWGKCLVLDVADRSLLLRHSPWLCKAILSLRQVVIDVACLLHAISALDTADVLQCRWI